MRSERDRLLIARRSNIARHGMIALAIFVSTTATAALAQRARFDVPAGPLPQAIITLARQAGVTIVTSDPRAVHVRVRAVHSVVGVEAALRIMLANTGYDAVRIDATTYAVRLGRRPAPRLPIKTHIRSPESLQPERDIIVTAAKAPQTLTSFGGTVQIVQLDEAGMRNAEGQGTAAIIGHLPVMASTGHGPGRDKLFVRGIADSSFTGATQAAVGQYLGEVRLNYNAPDPDLALYDFSRIELLEGPQATLYGAGSLGGILRLIPRRPVTGVMEGSAVSSVSIAANGRLGSDMAGVVNLPLGSEAAVRTVVYAGTTPGLVNDIQRHVRDAGRIRLGGGRMTTEAGLGNGWSMEVGGVYQRIGHQDARYAEGAQDPPTRASAIAQPATNRFGMAELTLRKRWDNGAELVSANALVDNTLTTRYDLSAVAPDVLNDSRNRAIVFSSETRLSRSSRDTGWVIGVHGVSSISRLTMLLDRGPDRLSRTQVNTGVADIALFGQSAFKVAPHLTVTLGGRLAYSEVRIPGPTPVIADTMDLAALRRGTLRILPSAAITWHPGDHVSAYVHYQPGYRVGGLAAIPFIDPVSGERSFTIGSFRPDTMDMVEAGIRFGSPGTSPVRASFALSASRWRNIQADILDTYGPYTTNIGDARILGIEGTVSWQPDKRITLTSAFFAAGGRRLADQSETMLNERAQLPNIPRFTLHFAAERSFAIGKETELLMQLQARYTGRSDLGVGGNSLLPQGNYVEMGTGFEVRRDEGIVFLEVDNLLNVRGNKFGLGNPYTAYRGDQRVPLQSRTVRLGIRRAW